MASISCLHAIEDIIYDPVFDGRKRLTYHNILFSKELFIYKLYFQRKKEDQLEVVGGELVKVFVFRYTNDCSV